MENQQFTLDINQSVIGMKANKIRCFAWRLW